MGYYTNFSITMYPTPKDLEWVCTNLEDISGYQFEIEGYDIKSFGSYKWYEHEEDMRNLSKLFPEILFILEGRGEESADVWRGFAANGLYYEENAELILPTFNKTKLR